MTSMSILLLGSKGLLGQAFQSVANVMNIPLVALSRQEINIHSNAQIQVGLAPFSDAKTIINCAAFTQVDQAETAFDEATLSNETGVKYLSEYCRDHEIRLCHFSTDYVFNGQSSAPYSEDAPCDPINAYGRSKFLGEQALMATTSNFYLFRIQWLFGDHGPHFLSTMTRLANTQDSLSVVSDQWGSPSWSIDIAIAVLSMISINAPTGIYHLANQGYTTWYDLAKLIFQFQKINCPVHSILSHDYPRPAKRPLNGRLNTSRYHEVSSYAMPTWQDSVQSYLSIKRPEQLPYTFRERIATINTLKPYQ